VAKTFLPMAIKQKVPVNFVICLFKVNFQDHTLLFLVFGFFDDFVQHHFISYESPLNEFILATINELVALLRAFVTILNNT
jgi:hypothetical protein